MAGQEQESFFVSSDSIIRRIWGNGDVILFIFAGAAGEFALHKTVDWLYFTGRLPADPLARLFSTVAYSRRIIFSNQADAFRAIDQITSIHQGVEQQRGKNIPNWAYRDVLFMLIDYSIRSYELLERPLTLEEKDEVVNVFYRMGIRMAITELPDHFTSWKKLREACLDTSMEKGEFTVDLYEQYRKHLGTIRYWVLIQSQKLLLPPSAKKLLGFGNSYLAPFLLQLYRLSYYLGMQRILKNAFLPFNYRSEIKALDVKNSLQA